MSVPAANFTSDNTAPVAASILKEIQTANSGSAPSYGADSYTQQLNNVAREVFECDVWFYPVATGTAANALALAQVSPPYGAVYCHEFAHIAKDECGAPEFYTGGAQLIHLPSTDGKIYPEAVRDAVAYAQEMGVHHVLPACVSLSQATEWGTVYAPSEIAALSETARSAGLAMHMDGARFANAVAHLGCTPGRTHFEGGNRRFIVRCQQERRPLCRGGGDIQSGACPTIRSASQAGGSLVVEAPISQCAVGRVPARRFVAR